VTPPNEPIRAGPATQEASTPFRQQTYELGGAIDNPNIGGGIESWTPGLPLVLPAPIKTGECPSFAIGGTH
jgi:hypothetical protein